MEGTVFLAAIVVGLTQFVRLLSEKNWKGALIIVLAVIAGIVVALVDTSMGVTDITVAQGIMLALGASGVVTVAQKIG